MEATLENTQDRLVLKVASFPDTALYTLDRVTARMKIDRKKLFFSRKPLELPFAEISSVDAFTTTVKKGTTDWIKFALRSGKRHFCVGSHEAAERIRSFMWLQ